MSIQSVNSLSGDSGGIEKPSQPEAKSFELKPEAQVIPANDGGSAARAKFIKVDVDQVDVPGIGAITITADRKNAFAARVAAAILNQEKAIIQAVETFAGTDRDLRGTIATALLAI